MPPAIKVFWVIYNGGKLCANKYRRYRRKRVQRIRKRFHCTCTILQDYRRTRGYYKDAYRDTCAPSLSTNTLEMRGINAEFTIISIVWVVVAVIMVVLVQTAHPCYCCRRNAQVDVPTFHPSQCVGVQISSEN